MIRLLFVLFVTLGGFAAAAVWNFRSDGPTEPIDPRELQTTLAAEVERLGLQELTKKLPSPKRGADEVTVASKPEPQPHRGNETRGAEPARIAADVAKPSTPQTLTGSPGSRESAQRGAGGTAAPIDSGDESVTEVEVLTPRAEFARDFGPDADGGVEIAGDALPIDEAAATRRPDWTDGSPGHDADRSAKLIRRMLAVYRSSGSGR